MFHSFIMQLLNQCCTDKTPLALILDDFHLMLRITAMDLNFTVEECMQYYQLIKIDLPAMYVKDLQKRTEGWIAGMKLAALSLQKGGDAEKMLAALTGTSRNISDYLFQEVFSLQPEDVQIFLERTSILNRLCAPLCDQVTEAPNSQEMLEHLEQADVFLVPLDETRTWYRYHHLFAEFLQERLRQKDPEQAKRLHLGQPEGWNGKNCWSTPLNII
jgi:LuxR family maltose regulon positive regulatory protein